MAEERTPSHASTSPTPDPEPDPTFTADEHKASARSWYGCSPHVVAGALSEARKKNLTQDEVKAHVKDFLKRKDTTERGDSE